MKKEIVFLIFFLLACVKTQSLPIRQVNSLFSKTANSSCIPTNITILNQAQIAEFRNETDIYDIVNKAYFYAGFKDIMYYQTSYNDDIVTSVISVINAGHLTLDTFYENSNKAIIFVQSSIRKDMMVIDQTYKVKSLYSFRNMLVFLKAFYGGCYN
jgi:S-adenosylmethionine/arginine decarboxylase-like enzyme